jgi:demethylmenaquinone methyltransferase / 2-methoxy-6-polyprenyl-1,4-benzoquinol methylase
LPWLGDKVAGDPDSYRYLAESIKKHPDQQALAELIQQAGFEGLSIENLLGGIVAIHKAYKY